jgi:hypothetical protein
MAFQIRSGEQKEYVSPNDPDGSDPTTWILGTLDLRARTYIQDETATFEVSSERPTDKAGVKLRIGERNVLIVRFGLKGWRNLKDAHGQEIPFEQDTVPLDGKSYPVVARRLIEMLPYELIEELAGAILALNTLMEHDRKNSGSR